MPHYKRQHFLPVAYLKYFAVDQTKCIRDDAWVWRFDGKEQKLVPVRSQCSADYHFSKTRATETEKRFHGIETRYCRCVDKIRSGKSLDAVEYGDLILATFEFHLRNAIHANRTDKEGIDAYNLRNVIFMKELLLGRKSGDVTREEITTHLERFWDIRILKSIQGHVFITSDNPACWISLDESSPGVQITLLPITPTQIVIAFDRRVVQIRDSPVTSEDEQTINAAQIENAGKCVYVSARLSAEDMATIAEQLASRTPNECEVRGETWKLKISGIDKAHRFSFLRRTPPLL